MPAASFPSYDSNASDPVDEIEGAESTASTRDDDVDPAVGKGCAEALIKRGLIDASHQSYVAALITHVANDAIAATHEMLRQGMIERSNEAVVAEFIKRTVRRRAWGIERPVAVGRLAQNFHQRRQAAALDSRRSGASANRSQS